MKNALEVWIFYLLFSWINEGRGNQKQLHCPRAGPGRIEAIFAGPDPDLQGRATLSLALAPGRLDPGPVGSGQGRVRVDPDPLIFSSQQNFFFQML